MGDTAAVLLSVLAEASVAVAATASRTAKTAVLADALGQAGPAEVGLAVAYLSGELPQRRTGVGHRSLVDLPPPAEVASLELVEVDAVFAALSATAGTGSAARRRALLVSLLARATLAEQRLLAALVSGELRQGALLAAATDAVAKAAGLPLPAVRTALMLTGSLPVVATEALTTGDLSGFRLEVGRPLAPMLAQPGTDLAAALARTPHPVVEWKLDGVRVQVHRDGDDVRVFTRTLDDITARVPELVATALSLPVRTVVLDGEAIALRPDGSPLPFQVTASRAASRTGPVPLTPFFFDLLHLDGEDLLGQPLAVRGEALRRVVPDRWRAPSTESGFEGFAADAVARGHEGVVVKDLTAAYDAGRRGGAWLKVKPVHTFDLVVLAAEWGHGRRTGLLSNLHLGARHEDGFVMLGKTFKGLTDELLTWQTEQLLARAVERTAWGVRARPELVVEIAVDGVQTSPRYPGGIALRFARVVRYRPDKAAADADELAALLALHVRA